jgi:hypothetical protein
MAPLCVGGTCVACTPENPVVCEDQLLLCDGTTNSCVPCVEHGQCPSGACELDVGRCFPGDFVVHVDGDGGQDYTTIEAAVAGVDGTHGVIVLHERDGETPYTTVGGLTIDGGKTIALLVAPGQAPVIQGEEDRRILGLDRSLRVDRLADGHRRYLPWHRSEVFAWRKSTAAT